MTDRIEKLKKAIRPEKYPLCTERMRLFTESYRETESQPQILRNEKAHAYILDNRTIFIEDDELIVGNIASKPMGLELECTNLIWTFKEIEALTSGEYTISQEDLNVLADINGYWKGRIFSKINTLLYDEKRLWPFELSGIILPPYKNRNPESWGMSAAGSSWGLPIVDPTLPDYAKVLNKGLNKIKEEIDQALKDLRITSSDSINKSFFLQAALVAINATIRHANRFADLAKEMVFKESNPKRKKELQRIEKTCRWVPANPPRNFYEAMQFLWFIFADFAGGSTPLGRFDQYMYPFFKKDRDRVGFNEEEVVELLQCLRIKDMQFNYTWGGAQREKWAGMAKWHNMTIGGQKPDGEDATNELTYLILKAIKQCQTPHHTVTLRVHDHTPENLMLKALEVVKTGIGMPAFVGDKSYINYMLKEGISLKEARNYALAGCLDCNIAGKSRITAFPMFNIPLVFDIFLHNGIEPRTGQQLGLKSGDLENFSSFEDLLSAFKLQLAYFMQLSAEHNNIWIKMKADLIPGAFFSLFWDDAVKEGRDIYNRTVPFENGAVMNVIGMINVADSLAAIKDIVFNQNKITLQELKSALSANWQGSEYQDIRKLFVSSPKYGNDEDSVDDLVADLYNFWAEEAVKFDTVYGGKHKPSAISITSHWPGGALTGATPDGRYAGETLADGCLSPGQGRDTKGPTAVIKSASKINQDLYQSMLLNMRFHPSALNTTGDLRKLSMLIKTYFGLGGKHIQFNVISKDTLLDAQKHPDQYRDLVVRIAGYSGYFVQLGKMIQDEIIKRTENTATY